VPAGHHREDASHDVLVRLDAGEEEKRVPPSDEGVDHPVVLDLQHAEEHRVVLGGDAHAREILGVGDGRFHRLGGSASEHALHESVLDFGDPDFPRQTDDVRMVLGSFHCVSHVRLFTSLLSKSA
jgi:hypothetical protein